MIEPCKLPRLLLNLLQRGLDRGNLHQSDADDLGPSKYRGESFLSVEIGFLYPNFFDTVWISLGDCPGVTEEVDGTGSRVVRSGSLDRMKQPYLCS